METVEVPRALFDKILSDVEVLIDDVESALDKTVRNRITDIDSKVVEGRTEAELDSYLKKRGVQVDRLDH